MFDLELQRRIREKKTPLALTLAPEAEKLNGKFVKNFIDMFGCWTRRQESCPRWCCGAERICVTGGWGRTYWRTLSARPMPRNCM